MSMTPSFCERHGTAKVEGLCPECFPLATRDHCGHEPEGRESALAPGSVDGDLTEPGRERNHYQGDNCDPPHAFLPPELSEGHRKLLAGEPCTCSCHGMTMSGICGTCCTDEEPDDAVPGMTGDISVADLPDADILDLAIEVLERRFHESVTQDQVTAGTAHAWIRYAARSLRLNPDLGEDVTPKDGHELSREQIRRHGTDRYPSPAAQFAKVLDEAGELGEAMMEWTGSSAPRRAAQFGRVAAEYADVGLALFALGDKLGLDLIACMHELVAGDTRDFTHFPPESGMDDQAAYDNGITG